jgi:protein TonB
MAQWGGRNQARIERSRPRVSASGRVVIALRITPTGQLAGLSGAQSSGDVGLDQAAVSTVQRARLPAAPDGLTEASHAFSLPVRFR